MPSPLPRFADGAVPEQRHPEIVDKLSRLAIEYPQSVSHRAAFRRLGSEFVYARKLMGEEAYRRTWIVLLRFSRAIEERFGIGAEVLIVYIPHHDVQIRTPAINDDILAYLPANRTQITKWIRYISAPDVRLAEKLQSLSSPSRIILPLFGGEDESTGQSLIGEIAKQIHSNDLYVQHGSVTGDQFFGRKMLINSIQANISAQQIPALFGMRKTGKTSILKELERQNSERVVDGSVVYVYVYIDLEDLPEIEFGNPVAEVLPDIIEKIRLRLGESNFRTQELAELDAACSLTDFKRAVQKILAHSSSRNLHIVLILDEIEHLCPPGAETAQSTSTSTLVPQFFGILRKLVQESRPTEQIRQTGSLSLVIAGLASASVESRELYGRENPLFNFAKAYYLSPFILAETDKLLRSLGKRQGVDWHEAAVELVQSETGGHAVLVRELASLAVAKCSNDGLDVLSIQECNIESCIELYRRSVASQIDQVLGYIERYYSLEWSLLEELMDGNDSETFVNFAKVYPKEVNRLERLGIIRQEGAGWCPTQLLKLGWRTGVDHISVARDRSVESRSVLDLISKGESKTLEFKSSFAAVVGPTGTSKEVMDSFLKVVISFMNTDGGSILVGIADSHEVVGIGPDLKKYQDSRDKLVLSVQSKLNSTIGADLASRVAISFPQVQDVDIMRCDVSASKEAVWALVEVAGKSNTLFVRQNANTQALNARETAAYIADRFQT